MLNADMRFYNYYTIGELDEYGQATTSNTPAGEIKMAIYVSNQSIQDNVNYKDCSYVGITQAPINDKYIIEYGGEKLKVLYINSQGRYNQAFLCEQ